ncbi:MAG: histidine phosphatase family protein [Pseudomonadota bacterium]
MAIQADDDAAAPAPSPLGTQDPTVRGTHTLYLVRHGQTDWNKSRRIQGATDIPINAKGRDQARRNGGVLADLLIDPALGDAAAQTGHLNFIASPFSRARETMEIVRATMGLPRHGYSTDPRIAELRFGEWEGRTWTDLRASETPAVAAYDADRFGFCPPGGESYADLMARVLEWYDALTSDTVVVTHGGTSRALRVGVFGLDRSAVADMSAPQDQVLKIADGQMSWL